MITPLLHRQPVALDKSLHRQSTLRLPVADWSQLSGMNSIFLTAAECANAASDMPIVFIRAGADAQGVVDYAPIGVFGLTEGENLFLDAGQWRGTHLPALMAAYPFCVQRADGDRTLVCIDAACAGLAEGGDGLRLFDDAGEPSELTRNKQAELERLDAQIALTRQVGRRLADLKLFVQRRFDATLPDGRKLSLEGFYTIDEDRVKALPDATVLAMHRDGLLGFIHAHWVSMGQMRRLLQWRIEREAATKLA
jgi:hypothetical protein